MKTIRILALRRLRHQPVRALIAAISVAAGVALAISLVIVVNSVTTSVQDATRALAGPTPLRVVGSTSRGGLDQRVTDAVANTDGVAVAVPVIQAVTLVEDSNHHSLPVLAFGVDCRVEAIVGPFGCTDAALNAGSADGPPIVSTSMAHTLGSGAVLRTDVGRVSLDGAPAVPGLDRLNGGRAIVMPIARAQELFARPGFIDVIYVQPKPGVDVTALQHRLEETVGSTNGVLGREDPPPAVGVLLIQFVPLFSLIAILGLAIGAVLVYNTVSLSIEERRRQLAIVGALGGTSRVIVGGTLVEAGVLGLVGGLLGAFGGIVVAGPITGSLNTFTERVAGIHLEVQAPPSTFVISTLLGLAVGVFAAWRPARRARRIDIAAELSNRDLRDDISVKSTVRRALLFATILVIGLDLCFVAQSNGALEQWQAGLAPLAFVIAVAAGTMLSAALAPIVLKVLGRRLAGGRAPSRLALANLTREPGRTGVMSVALGMAVGLAFMTSSYTVSTRQSITDSLTENLRGVSVSSLDPNNPANVDAKLAPATIDAIRTLPDVEKIQRGATVVVGHDSAQLIGVSAFEDPFLNAEVLQGSKDRARFEAGEVLIGPGMARRKGVRAGDTLHLDTPTGVVDVPVLGVWQNGSFGGFNVQMAYPLLEKLYGPQPVDSINVVPKPGVSNEQLVKEIEAAHLDPALRVQTAEQLADDIVKSIEGQLSSFWALQRAIMVTAFIAVLTTLLLVGVQRRREFGLLAAVGMQPKELARMILFEAILVAIAGSIVGVIVAVPMFGGLLLIAPVLLGWKEPFVLDATTAVVYAVVAVIVALLAAAWPAWRTSRIEVLSALQYE
ncbi:MAG TPA: FtsX-like permease family protein [Acidimicrobiales bacterium]|nr:FtsX-like permease family protein [Acidimicrobiales bacterium]